MPSGNYPPSAAPCSLYIHIPFCAVKCDYCDFYSVPAAPGDKRLADFVDVLIEDMERGLREYGVTVIPTVYIGGGTPSVLGAAGIGRLLDGLVPLLKEASGPGKSGEARPREVKRGEASLGEVKPPLEFTLECNPESADRAFLETCRDRGVNRISLGIQSFHEPSRRAVHRIGDAGRLPEQLALVSEIFGAAFSVDLITALPWQTEYILLKDIEKTLAHGPGHVSLYALTLENGTPLEQRLREARAAVPGIPDEDRADALWLAGRDALEQAGFAQYEVSNFARPGHRSAHNIRYWRMENWLGFGPSASGTVIDDRRGTGRRFTYPPDIASWFGRDANTPGSLAEELDRLTLIKETILMGFRYIEGPETLLFQARFQHPLESVIPRTMDKWRTRGLLQPDKTALTKAGLLFLNRFLLEAFEELDRTYT
ncbi:coproporphyrinogen III oxidase [Spirochaetia bacterium]|nr:coproporphyrinogen III oxidase [Spirochaetia bacterium]